MNENELDCSNEDEKYMELSSNDSNYELGNASFDPHIDSISMDDDPTKPPLHEEQNFLTLPKKVHKEHESGRFLRIKITLFKPFPQ